MPEVSLLVYSRTQIGLHSPRPPQREFSFILPMSLSGSNTHPAAWEGPLAPHSHSLHIQWARPVPSPQAIHFSPFPHHSPSPRFSTGVLPRGRLAVSRDTFGCSNLGRGLLLVSRGERPGLPLNSLRCTRQPLTTWASLPAQNVHGAEVEKPSPGPGTTIPCPHKLKGLLTIPASILPLQRILYQKPK